MLQITFYCANFKTIIIIIKDILHQFTVFLNQVEELTENIDCLIRNRLIG